jgi:hypothetical protein
LEAAIAEAPERKDAVLREVAMSQYTAGLYFHWIAEGLTKTRRQLASLNYDQLEVFFAAHKNASSIYKDRLREALEPFDSSSPANILKCVRSIFKENADYGKHSGPVLWLMNEIEGLLYIIRRRLRALRNPFLGLSISPIPLTAALLLLLVLTPVFYLSRVHREEGSVAPAIVAQKARNDVVVVLGTIKNPSEPLPTRVFKAAKELAEFFSAIPTLLLGASLSLGLIRWVSRDRSWQLRSLSDVEEKLRDLARGLQSELKSD